MKTNHGALLNAYYMRDLGEPAMRLSKGYPRIGPPSHLTRIIMLDTVVRGFIYDPSIDIFADESIRYYVAPREKAIYGVLNADLALRSYLGKQHGFAVLLSPICQNCLRPHVEHSNRKCLFEASTWDELLVPDSGIVKHINQ